MKTLWRKPIFLIVKAGITISILWWLSRKVDFGTILGKLLVLAPGSILIGFGLTFMGIILSVIRWGVLTRLIGISIVSSTIIRYGLIGCFFNQALPSSFGGDGIRFWLLYRDRIGASLAFRSIFLDRLTGLVFLLLISLCGMPRLLRQVFGLDLLMPTLGLAGLVILGVAVLAVITRQAHRLNRYRAGHFLVQIVGDLTLLASKPWILAQVAVLSITAQLLSCFVVWILIRGFNESVSLIDVLTITPVIFVLLVLPLSIAGWGLREGLFVAGFGLIGVSQEVAVTASVLFGLINLLASFVGGALWIADRSIAQQSSEPVGNR